MANLTPTATSTATAIANGTYFASYVDAKTIAPKYGLRSNDLTTEEERIESVCTTTIHPFTVLLNEPLETNEYVGLTGATKVLGEWQLEHSLTLQPTNNVNNLEWSTSVVVPNCSDSTYRYFTYVKDEKGHKLIRRWETHVKPRRLSIGSGGDYVKDRFGLNENGDWQSSRGWLTQESIIQFKFEREQMFDVLDVNKFNPNNIYIKLIPLENDLITKLHNATAVRIEVSKMRYGESELRTQVSKGVSYKSGDIIIFHITTPLARELAFSLTFHSADDKTLGESIVTPSMLTASDGELDLNVMEACVECESVIAHLKLPYLVVKPINSNSLDKLDFSFAYNWSKNWPNLDVGHRGNGKSYIANPPNEKENTIASFLRAHEAFADMIELDVHLTADGVPVVYHDFGVHTVKHSGNVTKPEGLEYVLIKDVTYEVLRNLRTFAVINNQIKEYPSHNSEPNQQQRIFPRLVDVLEALPNTLGIDVEIKWPQRKKYGELEAEQTIDKNYYTDTVIETVIRKGCGRPLLFSSFDADICTMLRFKQNLFPVMFLTMGETTKWEPFLDLRTRTFEQAINNAQAFELLGTAPHAEDFLGQKGAAMMQKALNLGQFALVWGDDCNSKDAVNYFREIGATATCYDRADLYMPESKEKAFFNSTDILSQFENQCRL